jgi:hypothetical protein
MGQFPYFSGCAPLLEMLSLDEAILDTELAESRRGVGEREVAAWALQGLLQAFERRMEEGEGEAVFPQSAARWMSSHPNRSRHALLLRYVILAVESCISCIA